MHLELVRLDHVQKAIEVEETEAKEDRIVVGDASIKEHVNIRSQCDQQDIVNSLPNQRPPFTNAQHLTRLGIFH